MLNRSTRNSQTGQIVLAIVPIITSLVASQPRLQQVILLICGGWTNLDNLRRGMVVLTFLFILWSFFHLLKEKDKPSKIIALTITATVIALTLISETLFQAGW